MQYYFAPMEGLTDSIYRRLHSRYFPGVDRYYTPFFSPTIHRKLTPKEARELPPADTLNYQLIPQILTKIPEDFLWMAQQCRDLGYTEVNLNVGCPSGTVTAKGKGAGMLCDPDRLCKFLDSIYSKSSLPISVKTRIGFHSSEEFPRLLDIFNRYPICELVIHPRVRSQFYNGSVDLQTFDYAVQNSKIPLCYNGNLNSTDDISRFSVAYPTVNAVMLGRGLIGNPGMLSNGVSVDTLQAFHDELLAEYTAAFGSPRNAMFRMKENWRHLLCMFENSDKAGKKLRKTTDINEFKQITNSVFKTLPLRTDLKPDW